jgi:CheY-like chemotaxis protein
MPTILVVEDDPHVRQLVKRVLQSVGYQVAEALDVADAQAHFAQHSPDLVLTDLHMPDMDGLALARWIREQNAVPIVVMTADIFYSPRDTPVLSKPFTLQALKNIVRDTLQSVPPPS